MSQEEAKEVINLDVLPPEVQALLDEAAKEQSEAEQSTIPFMSLKGKKFSIGDEKFGNKLDCIILADVHDYSWYDRAYDPDVTVPPACFAMGKVPANMVPHENSPHPQSEQCDGCPKNEFASAPNGKGKACRNGRRILIASLTDNRVNFGDLAIVNMSPTALRGFSKYTKNISTIKRLPLWSVITNLSFDEDSAYPLLVASYVSTAHPADIGIIANRLQEFQDMVEVPYDTSNYEEPEVATAASAKKSKMS